MPTVNQRQAIPLIREHRPFTASNLSAITGPHYTNGDLPVDWAAHYRDQALEGVIEYTVLSYQTPIGWVVRNRWVIPMLRYSLTTTRHQGVLWGARQGWDSPAYFPSEERAVPPNSYGPREGWW